MPERMPGTVMTMLYNMIALCAVAALLPAPARAAEKEFLIEIRDHRFVPAEVHVPAGEKLRIVLENQEDVPEEFDSHALNREKHVPPHGRVVLFVGPLEPGRYLFEGENSADAGSAALGVVVVP